MCDYKTTSRQGLKIYNSKAHYKKWISKNFQQPVISVEKFLIMKVILRSISRRSTHTTMLNFNVINVISMQSDTGLCNLLQRKNLVQKNVL